ncbi:MAG: alpha/beta hydrolase [Faecousia sp.]
MHIDMAMQAAKDFWRRNEYGLKEFVIRDGKMHPFAIICPGGGYNMVCNFLEGAPYARELNEQGFSAFVLYYRCKKKARYPAPMEDLARAVRDILSRAEELNLITDGYSIWGSSAGGHLAASFGTETMGYAKYHLPKPGALVLCYPVVTMGEKTHLGSRSNLLGEAPDTAMLTLTSVEQQITPAYPPTFVWCGDADRTVDPENSRMLAEALEKNSIPHRFVEYPGVDHGVGLGKGLTCEGWFDEAISFWEMQPTKAGRNS